MRFVFLILCALIGPAVLADEADDAGQLLAAQIRTAVPMTNSEIRGVLLVRGGKGKKDIPVVCKVVVHDAGWETVYETTATNQWPAEKLVIVHSTNQPNLYLYAQATAADAAVPVPKTITAADAVRPLAGSDFWLTDLALEFLHWPGQRKLKDGKSLGQECFVLESSTTNTTGMVRVKSWIDKETSGLLRAEGYDADKNLVKEFSLHGSSFTKVNGEYKLEKMQIRTPSTKSEKGSETTLKFDLPKN